jgi:putative transposase
MVRFVDELREKYSVESICEVIEFPISTYYAARKRAENPSARAVKDEELVVQIRRVWKEKGRMVYGAKKVWEQLRREGLEVARSRGGAADARPRHVRGGAQASPTPHHHPGRGES